MSTVEQEFTTKECALHGAVWGGILGAAVVGFSYLPILTGEAIYPAGITNRDVLVFSVNTALGALSGGYFAVGIHSLIYETRQITHSRGTVVDLEEAGTVIGGVLGVPIGYGLAAYFMRDRNLVTIAGAIAVTRLLGSFLGNWVGSKLERRLTLPRS